MDGLINNIRLEYDLLVRMKDSFEREIKDLPIGTLSTTVSKSRTYLKWKKGKKSKYLSMNRQEDVRIAQMLRRKRFLKENLTIIRNNIDAISNFLDSYRPIDPIGIMDNLSKAYQLPPGQEKEIPKGFVPQKAEECDFKSKSEQIIALVLEANSLEFMYEWGMVIKGKVYNPDFTIRIPGTSEFIIYEHFGMIDDPRYYRKMMQKLIDYWHEGIRLGETLIVTFETKENPLTASDVQGALNAILGKRN